MPSTAVAARKNSIARIAWKYPGNRKDAARRLERMKRAIETERRIKQKGGK